MNRIPAVFVFALAIPLLTTPTLTAYDFPLSREAIREAYFLGDRKDSSTIEFFSSYFRRPPLPKQGPHIAWMELETPYAQVVRHSALVPLGYTAQQAEQDFFNQPEPILVRLRIEFTPAYPNYIVESLPGAKGIRPRPWDFWRDFKIRLVQGKTILPQRVVGRPFFLVNGGLGGADVEARFDAAEIDSAPVRAEVLTPDGQRIVEDFDLSRVR